MINFYENLIGSLLIAVIISTTSLGTVLYYLSLSCLESCCFWRHFERCFSHHQASVNGELFGIYVSAGESKCLVVIADWLVCIMDVSGLGFDGNVFLAVEFSRLFFFFFVFL